MKASSGTLKNIKALIFRGLDPYQSPNAAFAGAASLSHMRKIKPQGLFCGSLKPCA
jgi:hypothetical protein